MRSVQCISHLVQRDRYCISIRSKSHLLLRGIVAGLISNVKYDIIKQKVWQNKVQKCAKTKRIDYSTVWDSKKGWQSLVEVSWNKTASMTTLGRYGHWPNSPNWKKSTCCCVAYCICELPTGNISHNGQNYISQDWWFLKNISVNCWSK